MKQIRTLQDLAINDAPPAFKTRIHVGCPNVGRREAFMAHAEAIFDRLWLSNDGPVLREFESRLEDHLGVNNTVAICNGTVALEIAIRALGLEGEVIVPAFTFVATAHALQWLGITPVFADIDPSTHNLDPDSVRRKITPRTTGIIGVHLWGRGAPVEELQAIADEYRLELMFDAAHAFGCSHRGRMIGGFGRCEVFSFHATKFFNTFEGGAIVTNDDGLAETIRLMRNFGFVDYDHVDCLGTNGKLTEIAAAMGLVNLDGIDGVIEVNRHNYKAYQEGLAGLVNLSLMPYDEAEKNNYQYIVVEVGGSSRATRDQIVEALHAENVLARRYFWPGCHKMHPYREFPSNASLQLPATRLASERIMVLPTGTAVNPGMVRAVTSLLRVLTEGSP